MIKRWLIVAPITLVIGLSAIAFSQARMNELHEQTFDEELLYVPNEKLLNHFTGGMSSVVADLLWLQCIQYTAQQWRGEAKFTWLNHMCQTITRLDPQFKGVYQWGGMTLAILKGDPNASIDLLKSGVPHCPDAWELPFEIARTHVLNNHDEERAAIYLAMAVATGDAPEHVFMWAENLKAKHNMFDVERSMWQDILATGKKPHMREKAERKLVEVDLRELCSILTPVSDAYRERTGRAPTSMRDLQTAGLIEGEPTDPLGGSFIFDAEGTVYSTTVLDGLQEERLRMLRAAVEKYHEQEGHWPDSMKTLSAWIPIGAPPHPYPGQDWTYDPATGEIH